MADQLHGNVYTLHCELMWTQNELLVTLSLLRDQTQRSIALHNAVTTLILNPITADDLRRMADTLNSVSPLHVEPLYYRLSDRLRAQDDILEDMPVTDSDDDYVDNPSPATVRQ